MSKVSLTEKQNIIEQLKKEVGNISENNFESYLGALVAITRVSQQRKQNNHSKSYNDGFYDALKCLNEELKETKQFIEIKNQK